jgi:transposase
MWTSKNRARYDRSKLRYPSDLTDDEWGLVEPLIPPGKTGGGKRTVIMREVVNGLMYILSTGCQWRAIPSYRFEFACHVTARAARSDVGCRRAQANQGQAPSGGRERRGQP